MNKTLTFSLLMIFISIQSMTYADELLVNRIKNEPPNSLEGIPRPKPGMTAKRVEEIFGNPKKFTIPVGNPPISRWEYEKFEVVFERNTVINTVIKTPIEMFVSDQ